MKNKKSTWTVIGLGNAVRDIIEMIEMNNGDVQYALLNQELPETLMNKLPTKTKVINLTTFQPQTEYYCFGFLDHRKSQLLEKLSLFHLTFPNLIHPSAVVSRSAVLEQGNIIGAGAVLAADTQLGNFNYINRSASLGHDAVLGNYNHVGPGAVISGRCNVGDKNFFGANSTIIDGVTILDDVVIGAGSTVLKNIENSGTYVGSPAHKLEK